jgi:phage terminase large subunit
MRNLRSGNNGLACFPAEDDQPGMDTATLPFKLGFLLDRSRYKIIYGGRGSAKSWSVARALLLRGTQEPLRILCAREFSVSLNESSHRLLADQTAELGLSDFYKVQKDRITGAIIHLGTSPSRISI